MRVTHHPYFQKLLYKFSEDLGPVPPARCRPRCQVALISPLRPRATLNPDEEARIPRTIFTLTAHLGLSGTISMATHFSSSKGGYIHYSVELKGKKTGDKLSRALKR